MEQKSSQTPREGGFADPRGGVVLLVNEYREGLQYYSAMLQAHGYQVRGCQSYEEGIRLVESEPFDFIIVSQGGLNFEGRCVLERVIQMDERPPVLVVARCLDMRCYLDAMQLGAVDYLVEPLTAGELRRAMETHLRFRAAA